MSDAKDVAEQVYARFGAGDIDGFLDLCSEEVEWVVNGPHQLEKCSDFHGKDGVRDFLAILDRTWAFSSFSPREFIAAGNKCVVLGEESGTYRDTGQGFNNRWAHVFTVRDGSLTSFREFLCHWTVDQKPPEMSWG